MSIEWSTLGLQAINVLVLLWLLQRFLYRPVLAVLERRRAAIDQQMAEAAAVQQKADAARQAVEDERIALATQREQLLAKAQAEAETTRAARLHDVEAQSERLIEAGRHQLEQERRDASAQLRRDAAQLAADFAQRVLARTPKGALLRAYVDEIADHAAQMTLTPSDEARVVTAEALSDPESAALVERLGPALGHVGQWRFDVDPSLLAGVEIHLADTVIGHTLAQDLARLQAAAATDEPPHDHAV
ncbi:hypothetical protein E4T66_05175 [Sinimarinibacterium sp. CAU 1509]|uniref:F0F1 ATP synthase subunit delta n=1 Tax=Sinimarinibacterium sp. CAU 1509 TaxID=2562283 RepID=UPI0010AB6149|nr:F0F1 ATP synthase subunit delta [Sinimarinibacterium sp. CAU 1509]TJY63104.1 hypothetical protein E4T66_05175 [Sinimarinibacterium sp. CAU 1509]